MPYVLIIVFAIMIGCSSMVSKFSYNYCIANSKTVEISQQCKKENAK